MAFWDSCDIPEKAQKRVECSKCHYGANIDYFDLFWLTGYELYNRCPKCGEEMQGGTIDPNVEPWYKQLEAAGHTGG